MKKILVVMAMTGACAFGQTKIDLATQSKQVDFSGADATKPAKTGSALPISCTSGEVYFLTTAPDGANLYGCMGNQTWAPQSGLPGLPPQIGNSGKVLSTDGTNFQWIPPAPAGSITVDAAGVVVGARNTENFTSGFGLTNMLTDTGTMITIQQNVDSAVVQSRAMTQSGATLWCGSSGGSSSVYSCGLSPALTAYTPGMVLNWTPDFAGAGGAITLNIDTLGAHSIVLADGVTNPGPLDVKAGNLYPIWYDGSQFRLLTAGNNPVTTAGARPVCTVPLRGIIWHTLAAADIKDDVAVCAKDATNAYDWRVLY